LGRVDLVGGDRLGEQEALQQVYAEVQGVVGLLVGFYAFEDDCEAQRVRESGESGDDRVGGFFVEGGGEAAVEFDDVDGEVSQVGEAGVAGAEIVECDLEAELAELGEGAAGDGEVVEECCFGDFEGEPVRVDAGGCQQLCGVVQEAGVGEFAGGEVGGDLERVAGMGGVPVCELPGGLGADVAAEGVDQAGVFGDGDEPVGAEQAAVWVVPAHQRFHAYQLVVSGGHDRLVVEGELVAVGGEGVAERVFQFVAFLDVVAELLVEHGDAFAAGGFGVGEGDVGVVEQLGGFCAGGGEEGDADGAVEVGLGGVEVVGLVEGGDELLCEVSCSLGSGGGGTEDGELVCVEPGDGVATSGGAAEPFCDGGEEFVPSAVAEGVVDGGEPVEVEEE